MPWLCTRYQSWNEHSTYSSSMYRLYTWYTLSIYLVQNDNVHLPGMTLLPVRKRADQFYIRINNNTFITFPDKLCTKTLLGIAPLQAV